MSITPGTRLEYVDLVEEHLDEIMRIDKIIAAMGDTEVVDMGPVATLKTHLGMHWQSPHSKTESCDRIPVWGSARDVWNQYRCEGA